MRVGLMADVHGANALRFVLARWADRILGNHERLLPVLSTANNGVTSVELP